MHLIERVLAILTPVFGVAWAAYVMAFGSDAGLPVPVLLVLVWGGAGLIVLWSLRLGAHVFTTRRAPEQRRVRRLLAEPAVLLVLFLGVWSGGAFWIRFFISRPALDDYVRTARPSIRRGGFTPGVRVGLFWLREAEVLPSGIVRFITTQCMFDDCGVVYSPEGRPPRIGEDSYRPLGGAWWHWWRSW